MIISDFIQGILMGLILIVAIGPQNLFVIQQGLKNSYVFTVCSICSISDTLLIIIGIILSRYLSDFSENFVYILKLIGASGCKCYHSCRLDSWLFSLQVGFLAAVWIPGCSFDSWLHVRF